jgi:hypothetical protein
MGIEFVSVRDDATYVYTIKLNDSTNLNVSIWPGEVFRPLSGMIEGPAVDPTGGSRNPKV